MKILDYLKENFIYLDGGMGTLLQARRLESGEMPETWNIEYPEVIIDIHRSYFDAGCNVVLANTFGANCLKYEEGELRDIVFAAIRNAREATAVCGGGYVALDIGPTGKLLKPLGDLDFEDAVEVFAKTVRLGVEAGVDLVFIETMNDSYETKAALLAAKGVMTKEDYCRLENKVYHISETISPDDVISRKYCEKYEKWRKLYPALKGI